ncbi:MAG: sporulation protein YqfD [Oscillospiraceae bacterium]
MTRRLLDFLRGSVLVELEGPFPERFLNLCATGDVNFWSVQWQNTNVLRVKLNLPDAKRAPALAEKSGCSCRRVREGGLPSFLRQFRKRPALLAGLALSLTAFVALSQVVLTVEVTGNEKVPTAVILSELRRQGLRIGTFGPTLEERQVAQQTQMNLPQLSFLTLNRHGTRVVAVVRERAEKPPLLAETVPADIIAAAPGIITHMEVTRGQRKFAEGDTVAAGEVLISGTVDLEEPQYSEIDMGTMTVRAGGRVWARTWRTLTAEIPLEAPVKQYTGGQKTRFSFSSMGSTINFYRNSGISFAKYDKIRKSKTPHLPGGLPLPVTFIRETLREYETTPQKLDEGAARGMLEEKLTLRLQALIGDGTVSAVKFQAAKQNGILTVTLQAECSEEIGRCVEYK